MKKRGKKAVGAKPPGYLNQRFRLLFCLMGAVLAGILAVSFSFLRGRAASVVLILGICLLLLAAVGYRRIFVPYREITNRMGHFFVGDLPREIRTLPCFYNPQMEKALEQIGTYVELASSLEDSRRQAQYQALQNQINPHFLYNTLESIRSEALLSGLESVDAMCEALANFFRYTISNMENVVTVREELSNVRNYFTIQQYRFEDRFTLRIVCGEPEEVSDCLIPKLTLQPIVENAIIHGLERQVGLGVVTIRLELTQTRLLITVSDNGLGIPAQTLNRINQDMLRKVSGGSGRGGIAIGNVNNRIQLLFGEDYGLTVYSTEGIGTDVEITLPKRSQLDLSRYQEKRGEE